MSEWKKKYDRDQRIVAGIAFVLVLAFLSFWGAVLYVAVYFIQKFW